MIDQLMSSLGEIGDKNISGIRIEFKPSTNVTKVP